MGAGSRGDELHEHGHGAVGLGGGTGEESIRDLALHHDAPELDLREPVEALDDDRRRDVVREIRDELAGARRSYA